jgi:hypothetical protein
METGTKENPWKLKTPPLSSDFKAILLDEKVPYQVKDIFFKQKPRPEDL